ncbi:MAG TPA: anti-sigma F factor [Clostridiales bacterium]|nr:MAG: anti-sigma F factor [Clostridiales bacterium GWD2_32_59]HAN09209.1 anti-sigma F factor [Clostridiales bacterium]
MEIAKFDNEMRLQFLNKSENESFARATVAAFVSQIDPTVTVITEIKTAVSEAVTNAVIYAYEDKEDFIYVRCGIKDNEVHITVEDKGVGIENIEKAIEPAYTSKPELERAGMGFTIMQSFMDEIMIESKVGAGTIVKMIKKIEE